MHSMVMKTEQGPKLPHQEQPDRSGDSYRARSTRLRNLVRFFEQYPNPKALDPESRQAMREQHGDTMRSLMQAMENVPWLQGMEPKQAASALADYFDGKANAADQTELEARGVRVLPSIRVEERPRVDRPREDGEVVHLPKLGNRNWEIVRINVRDRKYYIADPTDRRSVSDIIGDINSSRRRNGEVVGYEVDWDQLEELAA